MSLFSVMKMSSQALTANQLGLRTVANNISNAQTPGYIREELVVNPAPGQKQGNFTVGSGVRVVGVEQQINQFVAARLREAKSDLAGGSAQHGVLEEIEGLLGELSDTDLSSELSRFFASISDIANEPNSKSVRNVAVLEAKQLSQDIRTLDQRFREIRSRVNSEVTGAVDEVNQLVEDIAELNVQILNAEGGLVSNGVAVGLRDQRYSKLEQLSELVNVRVSEQENGSVSVYLGGDYLVLKGAHRELELSERSDRGLRVYDVVVSDTQGQIKAGSGKLAGLLEARDDTLAGVIDEFDDFAKTLAYEFNRVYTSGQGLDGYTSLESERTVSSSDVPLDALGLPYDPINGAFEVVLWNSETGEQRTTEIPVNLNGLDDDSTLEDIRAAIDAVDGMSATIEDDGRLSLSVDREGLQFAFANDTSGVLAALGVGTFFTGGGASDLGVSEVVVANPGFFSGSANGFGLDSDIAVQLAGLSDAELESHNGLSITELYERFTIQITQSTAAAGAVVEGARVFHNTLEAEHLSITGVNLDEEAIKMMSYERAFQASARVIQTANSLLELLVTL